MNTFFFKVCNSLLIVGILCTSLLLQAQTSERPPNVVFIIADQMRGDALSVLGNPNARTPNIDKLASKGVLFKNFYTNNPVCGPSRFSFFTGLYPHQHGTLANAEGKYQGGQIKKVKGTLAGYFQEKGYDMAWMGKNHTYDDAAAAQIGNKSMRPREDWRAYSKFVPPHWHSDFLQDSLVSNAHVNTEEAIAFIKADRKKPFFIHVSYFDPHPPYMAPADYTSKYTSAQMVLPPFVDPSRLSSRLDEEYRAKYFDRLSDAELTETMRYYYAAIEYGVDMQVGRVMKALEESGQLENTIIVFTGDHGDFMGHHRMVRKGMYLYDNLLHVPFIIYSPKMARKGKMVDNLGQSIDLMPTLIDLTGGTIPKGLSGRSLKPILEKPTVDSENFAIYGSAAYSDLPKNYFENPQPVFDPNSEVPLHTRIEKLTWAPELKTVMVRTKKWKLIKSETRPSELYYYQNSDDKETENVFGREEYSDITKKLEKKLKSIDWFEKN